MEEVEKQDRVHNSMLPEFAQNLSANLKKKYQAYSQIKALKSPQSLDRIFTFVIPEYAKDIVKLEVKKNRFIDAFQQAENFIKFHSNLDMFFTPEEIPEHQFVFNVDYKGLRKLNVAAVDGSFVRQGYTNFEFTLFRAISVIYSFSPDNISISYYPEEKGIQNYSLSRILTNTSEKNASHQVSIDRAFMEITLVNELITQNKKKIDMIILDGSILTEPLNLLSNPSQDAEIMAKYANLVKEYKKLYNLCDLREIDLVGVVKDTRSSTFRKLISRRIPQIITKMGNSSLTQMDYRKLLLYFSDLDLFHRILNVGDRSCAFSINSSGNSWVPRQLEILNSGLNNENRFLEDYHFYASYMKPVPYDYPIRIEFHQNKNSTHPKVIKTKIQRICERLLPICSMFEDFAVPIPQIEAHLRAKLSHSDLQMVINSLTREISSELQRYSKDMIFGRLESHQAQKFDDFLLKNNFLVPKRRERMPL